jgi:hypothetical protein
LKDSRKGHVISNVDILGVFHGALDIDRYLS